MFNLTDDLAYLQQKNKYEKLWFVDPTTGSLVLSVKSLPANLLFNLTAALIEK
jgi:hypothetical protein